MSRASAAARHLLLGVALAVAVLLPIASVVLPGYRLPILPRAHADGARGPITNVLPTLPYSAAPHPVARDYPDARPRDPLFVPSPPPQLLPLAAPPVHRNTVLPSPAGIIADPAATPWRERLPMWILIAWLAGSAIAAALWTIGIVAAIRLSRRGIPIVDGKIRQALASARQSMDVRSKVDFRILADLPSPLVCCWGARPRILLPTAATAWPADQLRSVLLHELAHVKRRDCHTQVLAQFACVMYWFNPLCWLAAHRLRIERERACDDLVLSHGVAPECYAEHLLEIARSLRNPSFARFGTVAMAQRSGLRHRIGDLLNQRLNRRAVSARLTITSLVMSAVVLLALSTLRLERRTAAMGQSVSPAPVVISATTQPTISQSTMNPAAPATQPSQTGTRCQQVSRFGRRR